MTQTGWNSYSRIDALKGLGGPYLARLHIDSDAWTHVVRWDGKVESACRARDWYRALPFRLVREPEVLVIGAPRRRAQLRRPHRTQVRRVLLGCVDSWASVSSGGLSLSENDLYTVEAFREYFDHLTDDGMLGSCAGAWTPRGWSPTRRHCSAPPRRPPVWRRS